MLQELFQPSPPGVQKNRLVVPDELLLREGGDVDAGPATHHRSLESNEVGISAIHAELGGLVLPMHMVDVVLVGAAQFGLQLGRVHGHIDLLYWGIT